LNYEKIYRLFAFPLHCVSVPGRLRQPGDTQLFQGRHVRHEKRDMSAAYAAYEPDDVVMTVNGTK
jgi:hypothetical protein